MCITVYILDIEDVKTGLILAAWREHNGTDWIYSEAKIETDDIKDSKRI